MMHVQPQKEHQWLQKMVGEWTYRTQACGSPPGSEMKAEGSQTIRAIGDIWVQGEGRGEMPGGGSATMIITLGYDPEKKRFVGTWVGSMMTHLWVYEGALDAAGKVLTLNAEGPSMTGNGKITKYQDILELKDDDCHTLTGRMLGEDGKWSYIMTAEYRRKK